MITVQQAEAFWSVVVDCLVRFHARPVSIARREVAEYRAHLAAAPVRMRRGMIFHAEPLDVASWITGETVEQGDVAEEYAAMMEAAFPTRSESLAVHETRAEYGKDTEAQR